ncbi:MAG: hypothetical protein LBT74_12025 [Acidobacteriota bacterium]|nr:hypothetical protein [Acidobacteriota bacterium]
MRRYAGFDAVPADSNKAGVVIDTEILGNFFAVFAYANPALARNKEYIDLLQDRFWVADAETPTHRFKIKCGILTRNPDDGAGGAPTYEHAIVLTDSSEGGAAADYVLVGFKGIARDESPELATAPLFFIIDRSGGRPRLLTERPLFAGDLAPDEFTPAHFPVRTATLTGRNGRDYAIKLGAIDRNEQNYTFVEFLSEDIEKEAWFAEGALMKKRELTPFSTEIILRGQNFLATGYGVAEDGGMLRETYETQELPERVEVFTETGKIVFDGKTKEVIPPAQP